MTTTLLEKPPRLRLSENILDNIPVTEVGRLTLQAYYGGLFDEVDAEVARNYFAAAALQERTILVLSEDAA